MRLDLGLAQTWDAVPVSGVEDAAYYYSTYNAEDKVSVTDNKKKYCFGWWTIQNWPKDNHKLMTI